MNSSKTMYAFTDHFCNNTTEIIVSLSFLVLLTILKIFFPTMYVENSMIRIVTLFIKNVKSIEEQLNRYRQSHLRILDQCFRYLA